MNTRRHRHHFFRPLLSLAALLAAQLSAQAQQPLSVDALALPSPVLAADQGPRLQQQSGAVQVALRLSDPPLALAAGANAKRLGSSMTLAQRQAYMAGIKSKQDSLAAQVRGLGGRELARVSKAYNALVISVDASKLPQVARLAGVTAVRPVVDHQISLATTVPYVGAAALHSLGLTGSGVKIAVLDSGIDYTHRNLGGSGQLADFTAAAAAAAGAAPAGLFPSAKVIGGYDFVGETWPSGALAPDPNPIDAGTGSGHGTHVADIAAGASQDGLHKGVAPGAKLYAVKVCSSVATSCSGIAILQGLDWAMDPRGDLSFADAADVVNLSLGANYGQRENPSTEAVSNLVRFGIVAAVAAGNAGDRPYIVSSPSNAPEAISVAQTAMPAAKAIPLVVNSPPTIAGTYGNTATVDWAPIVSGFSGGVRRAGASGTAAALACTAVDTIDFTGMVALIDRGSCAVSIKVANAAAKGAIGVLIANNASGDAPSFSFGGGSPLVETLVVTQTIGNMLKSALAGSAVLVSVSPAVSIPLVGSMASTSARGPSYNFSQIKPEIGAPGASVSALNGTGADEGGFGGTSGATPMIAGSAALLLQKFPSASPAEIKARLMNAANRAVYTNPATVPGELAPVSRIGAGELRVDAAAALNTGIWDASNPYSVGLSFGAVNATGISTLSKKVAVRNYSPSPRTYQITRAFRYANDAASGAVTLSAPASITVPANGTAAFALSLSIDASKLASWPLGAASSQGTGALLQQAEFDGYISVSDGTESAAVPWHVLPRKSAGVSASTSVNLGGTGSGAMTLGNAAGAIAGQTDVFALTGTSAQSSTVLPPYGGGQVLVDLKAVGVRPVSVSGSLAVQFAVAGFGSRAHPAYPAEFDIYVDANNDGVYDYAIYNTENGGFGVTGQTVITVVNLSNNSAVTRFFANADLNSPNLVATVLASDIGITSASQMFKFSVYASDNYFTGDLTDSIENMVHTLDTPRYAASSAAVSTPIGGSGSIGISSPAGGSLASPSQTGFLLLHTSAKTGRESDIVLVTP